MRYEASRKWWPPNTAKTFCPSVLIGVQVQVPCAACLGLQGCEADTTEAQLSVLEVVSKAAIKTSLTVMMRSSSVRNPLILLLPVLSLRKRQSGLETYRLCLPPSAIHRSFSQHRLALCRPPLNAATT